MGNDDNLIPNEKPQRLKDKIVEFIKGLFNKKSYTDQINSKASPEPNFS